MISVQDILNEKGGQVYTVSPDAFVLRAVEAMVENNVGGLIVTKDDKVCGVITERDYLRKIAVQGRRSADTKVKEIMSSPVIYTTPDCSIEEAMAIMTKQRVRHLPVMEGDTVRGVISIGDLVLRLTADQEVTIKTLQSYISDNYPR